MHADQRAEKGVDIEQIEDADVAGVRVENRREGRHAASLALVRRRPQTIKGVVSFAAAQNVIEYAPAVGPQLVFGGRQIARGCLADNPRRLLRFLGPILAGMANF